MFVVMYDLSDMPANSQTFLRQRTVYMPTGKNDKGEKVTKDHLETFLRYLIHLRLEDEPTHTNTGAHTNTHTHTNTRTLTQTHTHTHIFSFTG